MANWEKNCTKPGIPVEIMKAELPGEKKENMTKTDLLGTG